MMNPMGGTCLIPVCDGNNIKGDLYDEEVVS